MLSILILQIIVFSFLVGFSFSSKSLYAQDDDDGLAFFGASYSSGSYVGINIFYTDYWNDYGWYTSITAALPLQDGSIEGGNPTVSGASFGMDDVFAQHIGVNIFDYSDFSIGLGFIWGASFYNSSGVSAEPFVRVGGEIPILFRPINDIPIFILPFFEAMVHSDDEENWSSTRLGANFIAHFLFLDPLVFQLEGGIYQSNIEVQNISHNIESGLGYHWRVGVGIGI